MTVPKSRSKVDIRKIGAGLHSPSAQPHASSEASAGPASKVNQSDPKLCGMSAAGEPLPAGLSGMPGTSTGPTRPVDGGEARERAEGRVGEVNARIAERGANRSGTSAAAPAKGRRIRTFSQGSRKGDS